MHLAERAFVLLVAIAALAIAGLWSGDPLLEGLWRLPAALLLLGLALESYWARRAAVSADIQLGGRCFLGRAQPAAFLLRNGGARDLVIEYAPVVPAGFEPLGAPRRVQAPAHGAARDVCMLQPVRLGPQAWPEIPARLLGRLGLAWWSRRVAVACPVRIAPDTVRGERRPSGLAPGQRARRSAGAGSELLQLREYQPGDPLSRIDWKASARAGALITREFSEDQHLDILVAIDAGRASRARVGPLDRLGLYANIAARFAEHAIRHDDQVGLCVFSDRVLSVVAPDRGIAAVMRLRGALERLAVTPAESDLVGAAARIRNLLRRRSLIVLLTDFEEAAQEEPLARMLRVLSPPHLALVGGVRDPEIARAAFAPARGWRDPWVSLAAAEHEARTRARIGRLHAAGVPAVATRADLLERAVIDEYEMLRRRRRI